MKQIIIKVITKNDAPVEQWLSFVNQHPNGTIFQTPGMFELYRSTKLFEPVLTVAYSNDEIKGVMLACIQKEHSGILGMFTARSIISGGPLAYESHVVEELLKGYDQYMKRRVIYSQFRNLFETKDNQNVFGRYGYKRHDHLDIIFHLQKGEEALWSEIHKNRKKEIKNGMKKGVEVNEIKLSGTGHLLVIYEMLRGLYKKIGLPLPSIEFFKNAVDLFEPKGQLLTLVAKCDTRIIGFRMVLLFNGLVYDWYAASESDYLSYRPNDILPWEVIKWGAKHEYKSFDFGGAGKPNVAYGVREYKLKFGGELVNYGRYEKIHKPLLFKLGKTGISIIKWSKNGFKSRTKAEL